jgi:hypothetical protein
VAALISCLFASAEYRGEKQGQENNASENDLLLLATSQHNRQLSTFADKTSENDLLLLATSLPLRIVFIREFIISGFVIRECEFKSLIYLIRRFSLWVILS